MKSFVPYRLGIARLSVSLSLAIAAATLGGGLAFAQSSIVGLWRTQVDEGQVRISPCGDAICGYVVTSSFLKKQPDAKDVRNRDTALRGREVKGLLILSGFSGGPSAWTGGHVYNPSDGGTYSGRLMLTDPDTLKMRGCIVFPLCQTQTWTRVK